MIMRGIIFRRNILFCCIRKGVEGDNVIILVDKAGTLLAQIQSRIMFEFSVIPKISVQN